MDATEFTKSVHRIESADGHKADLVLLRPKCEKFSPESVVLIIHPALGISGSYYLKMGEALCVRNSWAVVIQEQRGQGTSSWIASRQKDWSYWDPVEHDFDLHLEVVRREFAQNPIYVLGHSVGCVLWSLWMGKKLLEKSPSFSLISGMLAIAGGSIHYQHHPSRTLLPYSWLVTAVTTALGYWPGERFGFGSAAEAKGFMGDWCRNIWTGKYQPHRCPHENMTETLREIKKPIRFITFDRDTYTPPICTATLASLYDPRHTSLVVIRADDFSEYDSMPGEVLHIRWARGPAILPFIESFINDSLNQSAPRAKL